MLAELHFGQAQEYTEVLVARQGCLQWLPTERTTAEQALQHEWLTGRAPAACQVAVLI